jgi:hypothetical protein
MSEQLEQVREMIARAGYQAEIKDVVCGEAKHPLYASDYFDTFDGDERVATVTTPRTGNMRYRIDGRVNEEPVLTNRPEVAARVVLESVVRGRVCRVLGINVWDT